jgi:hypothetical protein
VDGTNSATLEFFDPAGASLGVFAAPPQDGGWSFLGVRFDAGERAARVRITSGNTALGPNDGGAAADVVVMDNFIFAEPVPNVPNVYRFDGGAGNGLWSDPLNWHTDVVPPQGAVIELPGGGTSRYDLPPTTEYDRLLFTGTHRVIGAAGEARTIGLRSGIHVTSADGTLGQNLVVKLLAPQSFHIDARYFMYGFPNLSLEGTIHLNGHDLTLDGSGRFGLFSFYQSPAFYDPSHVLIDGSLGGRVIMNGDSRMDLSVYGATASGKLPREIIVNAGEAHLNTRLPGSPATTVSLNGGTLDAADSTTGPFTATGGTLATDFGRYTVSGDFSLAAAATLQIRRSIRVNGSVNLGGATLRPQTDAAVGVPVTIMENDGADPVAGTFGGIPEGGVVSRNSQLYRVTYRGGDGNDVVVTRVAEGRIEFRPPHQVRVQFAEGVAAPGLGREDLSLRNVTTGATVEVSQSDFAYDPATRTAMWTFRPRLPDGNYAATLGGDAIAAAQPAQFTFEFFLLTGDLNHDRSVNGGDFALLARNFGKSAMTYDQGDLNGDGNVNGADFSLLAANFGRTLPPPAPNAIAAARAAAPAALPSTQRAAPGSSKPRRAVGAAVRPAAPGAAPTPATKIARHPRLKRPGG